MESIMLRWEKLNINFGGQLVAIGVIFVLSFATFNILFRAATQDEFFKEILAALIGVILAAVITTMLLGSQTSGEEIKDRNVELFKEKVRLYQSFIVASLDCMQDGQISEAEAYQIKKHVYHLSLFSSEQTIDVVTGFLRAQFLRDTDPESVTLVDVVSVFRHELALKDVDALTRNIDLNAIDRLLQEGDGRQVLDRTRLELEQFQDRLLSALVQKQTDKAIVGEISADEIAGSGNGVAFSLTMPSKLYSEFYLEYATDPEIQAKWIEGTIRLTDVSKRAWPKLLKAAEESGFRLCDPDDPECAGLLAVLVDPRQAAHEAREEGHEEFRVVSLDHLVDAIVRLEQEAPKPASQPEG